MKKTLPILCVLMAILTIVIAMTTVSFSWFEPDVKEGIGLQYKDEAPLRDEGCDITATYSGAYNNTPGSSGYGLVQYGDQVSTASVTVSSGQTVYYKTVITNSSTEYDTTVSLFLPSFAPTTGGKASIGVAMPTNSFRTFSATQTDIHIIRNAHVKKYVSTDANPGELAVEWFVKCDSGSVTFNTSNVFLMYS